MPRTMAQKHYLTKKMKVRKPAWFKGGCENRIIPQDRSWLMDPAAIHLEMI